VVTEEGMLNDLFGISGNWRQNDELPSVELKVTYRPPWKSGGGLNFGAVKTGGAIGLKGSHSETEVGKVPLFIRPGDVITKFHETRSNGSR
jgi:hypothetical protein